MNELGMPPVRPLPPQVRDRALDTVLNSMDAPPKRRWSPVVAGAAAVVVVLTAAVAVALLTAGPGGSAGLEQLAAGARVGQSPTTPVAPRPTASTLEGCIEETAPGAPVVLRHEVEGVPAAWLARAGESDAAFCVMGDEAPVAARGKIPPADGRPEPRVVASTRDPATGVTAALVAVSAGVTRVEIMTSPQPEVDGSGAVCALQDGLALCSLAATGEVNVVGFDSGGGGISLPVP